MSEELYPLECRYPEDKRCFHVFTDLPSVGGGSVASRQSLNPKRPGKLTVAQIREALAAHERAQAASDAIRREAVPEGLKRHPAREALPPVPENSIVRAWRERLEASPAPRVVSSAVDPLEEIAKAAAARQRAESRIHRAVRQAKDAGVSVSDCARQLGMTRQGVYAMLARG